MTKELATLFSPNDFFWKKSVMGCALSHLGLWWKLVNEQIEIATYLIFEDDAKLVPGWRDVLTASMEHVPSDFDVLYLGGILPPNRQVFETVLEPVTKYYSRVRPNQIFGQKEPTPYFHSCAYAYILSRRGAVKIIEMIRNRGGYWTSADHIMCGPNSDLNVYFLTPPVAGCYQDDDPVYATSQFNNFSRVDSFDSDLWNNDERFTPAQVKTAGTCVEVPIGLLLDSVCSNKSIRTVPRFVCIKGHSLNFKDVYEKDWLYRLFDIKDDVAIEEVDESLEPPTDCPVFVLQRPHIRSATELLKKWNKAGAKFKILHLSDEHLEPEFRDPLVTYTFPCCVSVLRFYIRDDFPEGTETKINVIPLGYRRNPVGDSQGRTQHWSFFGTNWRGRHEAMKPLMNTALKYKCRFLSKWNDPSGLSAEEYLTEMQQSVFVPCPGGQNPETFRFYEALQCGCIPLVLKTAENEQWFHWVSEKIPLVALKSWDDAARIMMTLAANPDRLAIYRERVLTGWANWLKELEEASRAWLQ